MPKSAPARRTRLATLAHRLEVVGRGQRPRWCFATGGRSAPPHCCRCPRQRWRSCGWQTWTTLLCRATERRARTDGSSVAASRAAQRPGSATSSPDVSATCTRCARGALSRARRGPGDVSQRPVASQTNLRMRASRSRVHGGQNASAGTTLWNAGLAAQGPRPRRRGWAEPSLFRRTKRCQRRHQRRARGPRLSVGGHDVSGGREGSGRRRRVSGQSRGRCGALRSYPRPPRRLRRRPKWPMEKNTFNSLLTHVSRRSRHRTPPPT